MQRTPTAATAKRRIALLALVAAMVVWGTTFVVTKAAVQQFPPFTLAFLLDQAGMGPPKPTPTASK